MVRETRPTANIQEPVAITTVEIVQQKLDKNEAVNFSKGRLFGDVSLIVLEFSWLLIVVIWMIITFRMQ